MRFGVAVVGVLLVASLPLGEQPPTLFAARSFFSSDQVVAHAVPGDHTLLADGTVLGLQNTKGNRLTLLTYDSPSGPAGQVFATPAARDTKEIAVLGVRTGSLACYGTADQNFHFFERDPDVKHAAQDPALFTFLSDCPPTSLVDAGIERDELSHAPAHSFGLIVVQPGNGSQTDPSMYTEEAMRMYVSKLSDSGVVAFDISLGKVDLHQPVANAAAAAGLICYARDDLNPSIQRLLATVYPSSWIACARGPAFLGDGIGGDPRWHALDGSAGEAWTDDRIDLNWELDLSANP